MSKSKFYLEMNQFGEQINGIIKEMQNKILGLEEKVKSLESSNNLSTNAINDKVKYLEDINNFLAEEKLGCDLLTYFEKNAVEIANKANNKCEYYDDDYVDYGWTKDYILSGNKDRCHPYGVLCQNCQTMANITNYLRLLRCNTTDPNCNKNIQPTIHKINGVLYECYDLEKLSLLPHNTSKSRSQIMEELLDKINSQHALPPFPMEELRDKIYGQQALPPLPCKENLLKYGGGGLTIDDL